MFRPARDDRHGLCLGGVQLENCWNNEGPKNILKGNSLELKVQRQNSDFFAEADAACSGQRIQSCIEDAKYFIRLNPHRSIFRKLASGSAEKQRNLVGWQT